ncbi:hypothetical protein NPIL_257731, partial [Nephila pilipes]
MEGTLPTKVPVLPGEVNAAIKRCEMHTVPEVALGTDSSFGMVAVYMKSVLKV